MKTVIITGASGNLGTAVTNLFLEKGYQVVATAGKESAIKHQHFDARPVDLTDEAAAADFVQQTVDKYGQVHAALLLVGGYAAGNIEGTSGEDISRQIALNFNTAYFIARPLFKHMKQNKEGKIVFIGARPALAASYGKDLVAYGLSKSMLFRLAEYINEESKGTNVTATVIAPSTLDTPPNRKSMPDVDPDDWVKPDNLAEILEFVVSEKGSALRESVLKVYSNS
jgi:NAD(P)-dependent dehydrogenase (short-subunit alcohol dehydrogenase family)